MKFNYYKSLIEQAERIKAMLSAGCPKESALKSRAWQEIMVARLYTDFLPPIERRDLLSLSQNMGYIAYEVEQLMLCRGIKTSAGQLLLLELEPALSAFLEETKGLEKRQSCATALRRRVFSFLSVWRDCLVSGEDPLLLENAEAVADTLARYADTLEAIIINA